MKLDCPTYLYIIPDYKNGRFYMGRTMHYNPDLEVVKRDIRTDFERTGCDTSNIILMEVTDRNPLYPDLILALDGECDVIRMTKFNIKEQQYVMPITDVRVEIQDDRLWLPNAGDDK